VIGSEGATPGTTGVCGAEDVVLATRLVVRVRATRCSGGRAGGREGEFTVNDTQGLHLQIGQVAARTQLSIRTVRHYDDVGLVTPSARSAGGFRLYTDADVDRLLVIRRMKPLGFTLAEMKELLEALDVLDNKKVSAAERKAAARCLRDYRAKTDDSADRLRQQLVYAEELARLLIDRAGAEVGAGRGRSAHAITD